MIHCKDFEGFSLEDALSKVDIPEELITEMIKTSDLENECFTVRVYFKDGEE